MVVNGKGRNKWAIRRENNKKQEWKGKVRNEQTTRTEHRTPKENKDDKVSHNRIPAVAKEPIFFESYSCRILSNDVWTYRNSAASPPLSG